MDTFTALWAQPQTSIFTFFFEKFRRMFVEKNRYLLRVSYSRDYGQKSTQHWLRHDKVSIRCPAEGVTFSHWRDLPAPIHLNIGNAAMKALVFNLMNWIVSHDEMIIMLNLIHDCIRNNECAWLQPLYCNYCDYTRRLASKCLPELITEHLTRANYKCLKWIGLRQPDIDSPFWRWGISKLVASQ